MKYFFKVIFAFVSVALNAQQTPFVIPASSLLSTLISGDSVIYYQCHVEEATQQVSTASGQSFTSHPQKYSITEKYIIKKDSAGYRVRYFISSIIILPNRKFSGLKIREKQYWNFKKEKEEPLDEKDLRTLVALENKGREATEYDFAISKYTTNQLIIKKKKNFKQLVIDGNYVLSKLLFN
ncbi:MAG: hypothetical protein H0W61_09175 [Bacteroidetes bacterium]|nr:hypothetical protein [Bacteroidota bacterium]